MESILLVCVVWLFLMLLYWAVMAFDPKRG
jgi:hypothetical protein